MDLVNITNAMASSMKKKWNWGQIEGRENDNAT